MRLIDADNFNSRVRAAGGMAEEELTEDFKDGVLAVLDMMKTEPTVEVNNWIPIKERPPEENQRVLVSIYTKHKGKAVRSGTYHDHYFFNDNGDCWKETDKEVQAWQILPEAYESEGEE